MNTLVRVEAVEPYGTIALGHGTIEPTGEPVTFAGDQRPMAAIAEALEAGEEPIAEVPPYLVMFRAKTPGAPR